MSVLVLADHQSGRPSASISRLISGALKLGADVDVIVAGHNVAEVAADAAGYQGVRKVVVADGAALEHQFASTLAKLLIELAPNYDAIVAAANSVGKDVLPRVAAKLDIQQISDVIGIEPDGTFLRPIYAGNAVQKLTTCDVRKVVTIRLTAFEPVGRSDQPSSIENVAAIPTDDRVRFVSYTTSVSSRPDLSSSRVVVSGGRGLGSQERFEALIGPLADKLNGAVGASRAAVDAGYVPNDYQVGQTGKIVAPELYIACGISGAIQHLAGMKESKVIVAINTDADAPIFQFADYGLVADLNDVLPELTAKL